MRGVAAAGFGLLCACGGPATAMPAEAGGTASAEQASSLATAVLDPVQVHAMHGKSTLEWRGRRWVLKPGTDVEENQPIQVAPGATLQLRMGRRALLDLGSGSRFVILQSARDGQGDTRRTRLRLDQGYLRVVVSEEHGDGPIEVSFGPWSAHLGTGEHFFERAGAQASSCSRDGSIQIVGLSPGQPRAASASCVMLQPARSPIEVDLDRSQWETLRDSRRLHPTLAHAAEQVARSAMAQDVVDAAPPAAGPAPPPAAVAPPDADRPEWIVNVATYSDGDLARRHRQQLLEQNFRAAVRLDTINGRAAYRVVIEGLANESAAQSVVADLGERFGVRSAWAMRKR